MHETQQKLIHSMPGLAKAAESGLTERSWLGGPHEIGLEHTTLFVYKLEANWSHPATGGGALFPHHAGICGVCEVLSEKVP